MMGNKTTHVFTESGNGKAPFKFLTVYDMGGGTCDHCGTAIRYQFQLQSADGNFFVVGSDCIFKAGDAGLSTVANRELAKRRKAQRKAKRESKRLAELKAQRDKNEGGLTDWEVIQKKREAQKASNEVHRLFRVEQLAPWADQLGPFDKNGYGFVHDMVAKMRRGEKPQGRAGAIVVEILAKKEGRKGSNAFKVEQSRLMDLWGAVKVLAP